MQHTGHCFKAVLANPVIWVQGGGKKTIFLHFWHLAETVWNPLQRPGRTGRSSVFMNETLSAWVESPCNVSRQLAPHSRPNFLFTSGSRESETEKKTRRQQITVRSGYLLLFLHISCWIYDGHFQSSKERMWLLVWVTNKIPFFRTERFRGCTNRARNDIRHFQHIVFAIAFKILMGPYHYFSGLKA